MDKALKHEETELIGLDEEAERKLDRIPGMDSFATLIGLIVLDMLVYGFVEQYDWLKLPLLVLHGLVLLFSLHVSHVKPRTFLIAIAGVVVLIVGGIVGYSVGGPILRGLVVSAGALVFALPVVAILRRMVAIIRGRGVDLEAIWAAVSVYLLIGSVYAYAYSVVGWIAGAPFFVQTERATAVIYLYFSFVTQATVGYGDYTAASSFGKMMAVSQALIGQLYLVTVVALLVSNLRPSAREKLKNGGGARPRRQVAAIQEAVAEKSATGDATTGAPAGAPEDASS